MASVIVSPGWAAFSAACKFPPFGTFMLAAHKGSDQAARRVRVFNFIDFFPLDTPVPWWPSSATHTPDVLKLWFRGRIAYCGPKRLIQVVISLILTFLSNARINEIGGYFASIAR